MRNSAILFFGFAAMLTAGLLTKPKQLTPLEKKYISMSDSMTYYYQKRHCYFACGNTDSAYQVEKIYWYYRDNVVNLQRILFDSLTPNGQAEEKMSCDCK